MNEKRLAMRTCTRCHVAYPATPAFFRPDPRWPCKYHSRCRKCECVTNTRYNAAHRDALRIAKAKWKATHPEIIRTSNAKFYKTHPEFFAKWRVANRETIRKNRAKWHTANPGAKKAHVAIESAIKAGRLTRPTRCEICGHSGRIELHHPDYSQPLRIVATCRPCHVAIHKQGVRV